MTEPKGERRRQPRAKAEAGLTLAAKPHVAEVQVKDISLSGLCFRFGHPLEFMTRLSMTLVFERSDPPGASGAAATVECEGTVVRCEPNEGNGKQYDIAVFFTRLDEEGRKAVENYVRTHL